ncbi:MAG TPA: hypothetical protein VFJ16_12655 [Longimicrobium sp.]|nr:hypothetical protein [Longimicrobium sp.]
MARRPNYGAEKRSKELGKQRKKEEKAEKKRARKEGELAASDVTRDGEFDVPPMVKPGAGPDGEGAAGSADGE